MLDNTITLNVSVDGGQTSNSVVYERFEENLNRSVYVGPSHTVAKRQTLTFYRTNPKPAGSFRGVGKCAIKASTDVTFLSGDGVTSTTAPLICEVSFAIPVGCETDDVQFIMHTVATALENDTLTNKLCNQLMI